MVPTRLYTRSGGYVVTVHVPPFNPQAEVISWGSRIFVRNPDGAYREGIIWYATGAGGMADATEGDAPDLPLKGAP